MQLWHRSCLEKPCQLNGIIGLFLNIIPKNIDRQLKLSVSDFTRQRKLSFTRLIVFVLSLVASGKSRGVDIKSTEFFNSARRNGLWHNANAPHRSNVTRARKKVPWTVFQDILGRAVALAYSLWPRETSYLWNKMSVFAMDGSKFTLPATEQIRAEFDPESGLDHDGKGHYPQCLVMTAYDVFRQLPVARVVGSIHDSERDQAQSLLSHIPPNSVLLYDRGFPSYAFIQNLREHHRGYFLFRCPAQSTFPAVEAFIREGKDEDFILITPSSNYLRHAGAKQRGKAHLIQLRVIRLESPDGTISVLLTNMLNKGSFPKEQIIELYFRRWAIEGHYRNEKVVLGIEEFHGKTGNSIRQELFAVLIMTVIARTLMVLASKSLNSDAGECQFKNAITALACDAAVLVPDDPEKAASIFSEILDRIAAVRYYRPKTPKPTQPRVTKRAHNKWCAKRAEKLANP